MEIPEKFKPKLGAKPAHKPRLKKEKPEKPQEPNQLSVATKELEPTKPSDAPDTFTAATDAAVKCGPYQISIFPFT